MANTVAWRKRANSFWLIVCALMTITVLVGFWPSYYGSLFEGSLDKPPIIHFHGIVFLGWMALFTAQAVLASTGRISLHRKIGKIGIAYGVLIIIVGLMATFYRLSNDMTARPVEEAFSRLLAPFTDMVVFAIFFGAAIYFRKQSEIHRRLMLLATVMFLIAAVLRMDLPGSGPVFLSIWLAPIFLAMVYDYASRRLIHPVYIIGLVSLTIVSFREQVNDSELWLSIARSLAKLVT